MDGIGFPQLNIASYPSQIFWLVVSFVVLYVLMAKIALPRLAAVIDARQTHKDDNLSKAAALSADAEKMKLGYEASLAKAQQSATDAMVSAAQAISEKTAEEQAKFADASRKRQITAEQAIIKAKQDALQSLADISAEIAADMAQKIADVTISKAEAKKAVTAVMEKA